MPMPLDHPASVPPHEVALRLGVRAHDFGRMPARELAAVVAAGGFHQVQLALNKAINGLNLEAGDLTPELAREIGQAFRDQGVEITVLGCYINPIHPDRAVRARLLEYFKDHLRVARDFGCRLVGLESGSVQADYSPHPANHEPAAFREMLGSLAELVATAQECGVGVAFEAVTSHTVSTPRKMREVLDTLQSNHLRVIWDPVNLLSAENVTRQREITDEALQLFGDRVAVVHAKDFVRQEGVLRPVPAGCGELDYRPVLNFVRQRGGQIPVLLEEADAQAAALASGRLREQFHMMSEVKP